MAPDNSWVRTEYADIAGRDIVHYRQKIKHLMPNVAGCEYPGEYRFNFRRRDFIDFIQK